MQRDRLASPVGIELTGSGGGRITGITTDFSDFGIGAYVWSSVPRGTVVTASLGSFFSDAQMVGIVRDCVQDDFNAYRLSIEFETA